VTIPNPVLDYQERLVRALMISESAALGEDRTADRGQVQTVLDERLYPMILEWSNLPFLPPPELIVLFDRFATSMEEFDYVNREFQYRTLWIFFASTLVDRDGRPLMLTLTEELEGLTRLTVRQAVRARALAILCPTPKLDGSFTGSIAKLREALKSPEYVDMFYHRVLRSPSWKLRPYDLFATLDHDWMAHQVRSWDQRSIRSFLSGRLRQRNLKAEELEGKIDLAARALTGVLQAIIETRTPKLDTFDAILDVVRARPSGALAEAVLRRVLPLVNVGDVTWASQEMPTGGYVDISTRGTFDRLLISNLAYSDEEFARRMTEGELLYYELETPPASQPPKQYVLLDASPATWGIPRLAGSAVALSVVNRARERRADATIFGAGRIERPFMDLDRASGIHDLLDHQRWEEDLTADLRALTARVTKETQGHPTGADLFLCTEADRLKEIHDWARSSDLPPRVRLHVFASDQIDGRATLWRRESGAFIPLCTLSLALKDLLPEPDPEPPPLPPATSSPIAFRSTKPEVNWDWGSNVTAAAIDPSGLAISGHENGEIHYWDAVRAIHLLHRLKFSQPVASVAISGGQAVVAFEREVTYNAKRFSMCSFPTDRGDVVPIQSCLFPADRGVVRPGWEPGQFFWWSSPATLVEYEARTFTVRSYPDMLKPPQQSFVVDPATKSVIWRDSASRTVAFDLKEKRIAPASRFQSVLQRHVRHEAIDAEGKVAVEMTTASSDVEVRWLPPSETVRREVIERCQHPKAVSAAANRLIAVNTDSIWFWMLKERKLVREIVSPRQMLLRIHFGIAEARRENALFLEFQGGSGLVLHWDETGSAEGAVQVDPIINPLQMMYRSQLHGGTAMFRSRSSSEVKPGTGESPIPAGPWRLHCRSDRCIEFHKDGHERPLMHFWFRAKPVTWVLASAEVVAGNAITSLIPADGRTLLKDPVRLARMLESGNG
jgi:hypothetical protein